MKLSVAWNGRELPIEITGTEPALRFALGDTPAREAHVERPEPGVYSVLLEGRSYDAYVEADGESLIVMVGGHRFEMEVRDPRQWSAASASRGLEGRQTITASMPGKVIRILVAEGQEVRAGEGIVVVEAMKMQNEMQAARSGRVVSVSAREGATVAAGEILATIE